MTTWLCVSHLGFSAHIDLPGPVVPPLRDHTTGIGRCVLRVVRRH